MRLAYLMGSLALLLAIGVSSVDAQPGYPPAGSSVYQQSFPPAWQPPSVTALPPVYGQSPVAAASYAPQPQGQWVFIPEPANAAPGQVNGTVVMPQTAPEPLPAPAVTEFAHVMVDQVPTPYDDRLGPTVRIFEPKARVYFDTGWEAPDKLNLFHDGALSAAINFLELYWQHRWPQTIGALDLPLGHPDWRWGPALGIGIAPQAGASSDGTRQSSGAPVLMLSAGLQFDFPLVSAHDGRTSQLPTAGVEIGYALGVSSDESLDYIADGAIYVGVTIHVLP